MTDATSHGSATRRTGSPTNRFLRLSDLAAFERMKFTTRQRIEGPYSGRHISRKLGGSGEFADYREYSPGEDLRRLDWQVLARTGRAYLRQFQDETNLLCLIAIDVSGSMAFGGLDALPRAGDPSATGSKLEFVQYLTTALSWLISHGQDQVGLAVLSDTLAEFLPPGATQGQLARMHTVIENLTTRPVTKMATGLRELFERMRRRHVLIVCSDFLMDDAADVFSTLRLFRHRRSDVIVLHVIHPEEESLPDGAAIRFEGLEGEGLVSCSPAEIRAAYRERFEEHVATIRTLALTSGCDYRRLPTAQGWKTALAGFMRDRSPG